MRITPKESYSFLRGWQSLRTTMLAIFVLAITLALGKSLPSICSLVDIMYASALGHDTVYSNAFREDSWEGLRTGMAFSDVLAAVGRPLRVRLIKNEEVWDYSESPGDTHYWKRTVVFQKGRVARIESWFYID